MKNKKSVVVIGGGTGTYNLLQGLKRYWGEIDITKVVPTADSGGSTGRLRDEFGQLPVGDARMGLAALAADDDGQYYQLLRELLLYRFDRGQGISGHNFGNLLLVALTDMLGSETEAIKAASRLFRVRGRVLPVSNCCTHLCATYDDGVVVTSEHEIDEPSEERAAHRIARLSLLEPAEISPEVKEAIRGADMIVMGPGDLYASLLSICVVDGVAEAVTESPAQFVYITNLMSRPGQTRGMRQTDYLREIDSVVKRHPDTVIINTTPLPERVLQKYETEGDYPVEDDLSNGAKIIRDDFLETEEVVMRSGDVLKRALIRHDGHKLAAALMKLL